MELKRPSDRDSEIVISSYGKLHLCVNSKASHNLKCVLDERHPPMHVERLSTRRHYRAVSAHAARGSPFYDS